MIRQYKYGLKRIFTEYADTGAVRLYADQDGLTMLTMEAAKMQGIAASVDDEADRVRNIFKSAFQQSDSDLEGLLPEHFTDTLTQRAASDLRTEDDDVDWSITLTHVETIVHACRTSQAFALAAEQRALVAEAKTREALHWLKVLHEAVLKGLPAAATR